MRILLPPPPTGVFITRDTTSYDIILKVDDTGGTLALNWKEISGPALRQAKYSCVADIYAKLTPESELIEIGSYYNTLDLNESGNYSFNFFKNVEGTSNVAGIITMRFNSNNFRDMMESISAMNMNFYIPISSIELKISFNVISKS